MTLRRASAVIVGAYVVMWLPAIFVRLVHVPDIAAIALLVVGGAIGAFGGYHEGRTLAPFSGREHRDAVIGWSILLVPIGAITSFLLPIPWAIIAAAAWVIAVVLVAHSLLAGAPADSSPRLAESEPVLDRSTQ